MTLSLSMSDALFLLAILYYVEGESTGALAWTLEKQRVLAKLIRRLERLQGRG
jgi:hypothetical protein